MGRSRLVSIALAGALVAHARSGRTDVAAAAPGWVSHPASLSTRTQHEAPQVSGGPASCGTASTAPRADLTQRSESTAHPSRLTSDAHHLQPQVSGDGRWEAPTARTIQIFTQQGRRRQPQPRSSRTRCGCPRRSTGLGDRVVWLDQIGANYQIFHAEARGRRSAQHCSI